MLIPSVTVRPASERSATFTLLDTRSHKGTEYTLQHRTAGVDPMFRVTVHPTEAWGVLFYARDGAKNGRWFLTEAEARACFNRWTGAE